MTTRLLVDPELLPLLDAMPTRDFNNEMLAEARQMAEARFDMFPEPVIAPVRHAVPATAGYPAVDVLVFTPAGPAKQRPALLHIHGGGMVIGSAHGFRREPAALAHALDCVVVSVDYRLAPETPFPGPQEDCYAALLWLHANATSLGVDGCRVAVTGESAGGGLAAAVAQMARDCGGGALCGQILIYPMLDHRTGGTSDPYFNATTGEFVWTRAHNRFGWEALKGDYQLDDARLGWFSPSRATSLSGLAPAYIATGALDLFLDENLDYARRLADAGVPIELHSYAGAFHGFNMMASAAISQRFNRDLLEAAARILSVSG